MGSGAPGPIRVELAQTSASCHYDSMAFSATIWYAEPTSRNSRRSGGLPARRSGPGPRGRSPPGQAPLRWITPSRNAMSAAEVILGPSKNTRVPRSFKPSAASASNNAEAAETSRHPQHFQIPVPGGGRCHFSMQNQAANRSWRRSAGVNAGGGLAVGVATTSVLFFTAETGRAPSSQVR